jgi:hypothetical protein
MQLLTARRGGGGSSTSVEMYEIYAVLYFTSCLSVSSICCTKGAYMSESRDYNYVLSGA